jgi:hypothetical protein
MQTLLCIPFYLQTGDGDNAGTSKTKASSEKLKGGQDKQPSAVMSNGLPSVVRLIAVCNTVIPT